MLRLIKNNLRYHTFNKFFFIAAAMLFFLGSRGAQRCGFNENIYVMRYGIPIACGVVLLNTNIENRSGSYRSKLTAGFTKRQIYFSHIISSALCSLILFFIIAFPIYISAKNTYTTLDVPITMLTLMMIYVLTAVVTACLHLNMTGVIKAVLTILFIFLVCIAAVKPTQDMLNEDRYNYEIIFDPSRVNTVGYDAAHVVIKTPNTDYPTGIKRAVLKTIAFTDPCSQIKYSESVPDVDYFSEDPYNSDFVEIEYWCFPLITLGIASAVSLLSYRSYRRKDLR